MSERWLPVVGYEGRYLVSDQGRVRSLPRKNRPHGGELRWTVGAKGYPYVQLSSGSRGSSRRRAVHKLVAEAFLGVCPVGLEVRHLDGDSGNPRLGNLAYGTHSENTLDQVRHGQHNQARKQECPREHGPYTGRHPRGDRYCRTCAREAEARHLAARESGTRERPTHCVHDHEFTPENTYWYRGHAYCRTCARERSREYKQRKRQQRGITA